MVSPTAEILAGYQAVQEEESRLAERLGTLSGEPAISKDGVRVAMMAKAGMVAVPCVRAEAYREARITVQGCGVPWIRSAVSNPRAL